MRALFYRAVLFTRSISVGAQSCRYLAGVAADFHLRLPLEAAFHDFLRMHGQRLSLLDRGWDLCVGTENMRLAARLLTQLRRKTSTLISLGDHVTYVTNEYGLSELRARVCSLVMNRFFQHLGWRDIRHVPSDHDVGVRVLLLESRR